MKKTERILSFSPYAMWRLHALYEVAMCHNLQWRGHAYRYVSCDGLFSDCDMFWEATLPRNASSCAICQAQVKPFLDDCRISSTPLGKYKLPTDLIAAREFEQSLKDADLLGAIFNGYPVSSWVKSSVHSHLRINAIDLGNPKHCRTMRSYVYSGAVALNCISRMLDEVQPTILLLFNGRLSITRLALELAKERGIRVVCHERGLKKETLLLWENENCLSLQPYAQLWKEWGDVPLNVREVSEVTQWLLDRAQGANLNWKTFSVQSSLGAAATFLEQQQGRKIWSLFTSSTDEIVADDDRTTVFGTQYHWIEETVAFVAKRPDVALVIRVHPNSGGGKSTGRNQEELAFFQKFRAALPSNVYLVMPDDQVSSYALISRTHVGFVYGSTVALEMACRGIPVLLAARSPWMPCSAIHLIADRANYSALLATTAERVPSVDEVEKIAVAAYRFAYAYVHRWNIPFPLVHMPDVHHGTLTAKTLEEFKPGVHECLDYCTDILLGESPAVPVSGARVKQRNHSEEIEALRRGMKAVVSEAHVATTRRLSVVITCYNYGAYLRDCVRSVARQTFRDFELIIVNDGSTDNSLDVAKACVAEFPALGIKLIDQPNSGQPALARNAGVRHAKGEFILPIDADDQIDPSYLEHAFALIEADRTVDLVYADALIDNGKTRTPRKAGRFDIASLTAANPIVYCSIYRRELWERVGGYRDNVRGYEDWDFWIALGLAGARAVHADCIGLVYNEKTSGVYSETVAHHHERVARIVLNNPTGYSAAQRHNAEALLGVFTPSRVHTPAPADGPRPMMTTPDEFARIVTEAETLVRSGRLDEAIMKIEATLSFAPKGECAARAQEILDLLRAARPAEDEFFGADEVQNIQQLIIAYTQNPADPSREHLVALQQGLMNFLDTAELLALERQFAGTFGEVFRAMATCGLPEEAANVESDARLALLDQALANGTNSNGAFDYRPLLVRMLCAPAHRGILAVKPEQLPGWLRNDLAIYCSTLGSSRGVASAKELCAVPDV